MQNILECSRGLNIGTVTKDAVSDLKHNDLSFPEAGSDKHGKPTTCGLNALKRVGAMVECKVIKLPKM